MRCLFTWLLCAIYVADKAVRFINNTSILDKSAEKWRRTIPGQRVLCLMILALWVVCALYSDNRWHAGRKHIDIVTKCIGYVYCFIVLWVWSISQSTLKILCNFKIIHVPCNNIYEDANTCVCTIVSNYSIVVGIYMVNCIRHFK